MLVDPEFWLGQVVGNDWQYMSLTSVWEVTPLTFRKKVQDGRRNCRYGKPSAADA